MLGDRFRRIVNVALGRREFTFELDGGDTSLRAGSSSEGSCKRFIISGSIPEWLLRGEEITRTPCNFPFTSASISSFPGTKAYPWGRLALPSLHSVCGYNSLTAVNGRCLSENAVSIQVQLDRWGQRACIIRLQIS